MSAEIAELHLDRNVHIGSSDSPHSRMTEDGDEPTLGERVARDGPGTTPVAVRLPEPLLERLDTIWRDGEFATRSEFVRAVLRRVAEDPAAFAAESPEAGASRRRIRANGDERR